MRFFGDGLGKRVASSLLNYSVPEDITAEEHLADYVPLRMLQTECWSAWPASF